MHSVNATHDLRTIGAREWPRCTTPRLKEVIHGVSVDGFVVPVPKGKLASHRRRVLGGFK
jgi:hypothetical protein